MRDDKYTVALCYNMSGDENLTTVFKFYRSFSLKSLLMTIP